MKAREKSFALPIGTLVDHYRIDAVLGEGGFGVTYKAFDSQLEKTVALKEYMPRFLAHRESGKSEIEPIPDKSSDFDFGVERFLDEARTLAKFNHPNIVRVNHFLRANGSAYLVMDYEEGETLAQYIDRCHGRVEDEMLISLLITQLLDGLSVVHEAGFLHRDIKPSNIYLRGSTEPVLIDFGAARLALGGHSVDLTSIVSHGYAPGEQYSSDPSSQGPWTDLYALGASLYRCITGKIPVPSTERVGALANGDADPLHPVRAICNARFSDELLSAVDWMLQPAWKQRPQSVAEVQAKLLLTRLPDDPRSQEQGTKNLKNSGLNEGESFDDWHVLGPETEQCELAPVLDQSQARSQNKKSPLLGIRLPPDALDSERFGPELQLIPPGKFMMGDAKGRGAPDERPAHQVTIPEPLAVSSFPVTFDQYDQFCWHNGWKLPEDNGWGRENRPVINISWNEAVAFTMWLSETSGHKYRLLTEAEWEYAARSGSTLDYWWGAGVGTGNANCSTCGSMWDNQKTAPVGSFSPNQFGISDMLGNVCEWVTDSYQDSYTLAPSDGSAVHSKETNQRVVRGGSWRDLPEDIRCAVRRGALAETKSGFIGFRVVRPCTAEERKMLDCASNKRETTNPRSVSSGFHTTGVERSGIPKHADGEVATQENIWRQKFELLVRHVIPYVQSKATVNRYQVSLLLTGLFAAWFGYFLLTDARQVEAGLVVRDMIRGSLTGPEMVVVPAGKFWMGDESGLGMSSEAPAHKVRIRKAFAIGKYEVSFAEYDLFANVTGRKLPDDNGWGRGQRPVINVSWQDATAYAEWLSKMTGFSYRLPSEAEWEYAAKHPVRLQVPHPDGFVIELLAHCSDCIREGDLKTLEVGSLPADGFGLYDLSGNVWEWVEDCWHDSYRGAPGNQKPWLERGGCSSGVMRGGSWQDGRRHLRLTVRLKAEKSSKGGAYGFRLVRELSSR